MNKSRVWQVLGVLGLAITVFLLARLILQSRFDVVNNSGQEIVELTVSVLGGGSKHRFESIAAGSTARAHFRVG